MNWTLVLGLVLAVMALIIGYGFGWRGCLKATAPTLERQVRVEISDHVLLLSAWRRELANWIIRRDPDAFLVTYENAHRDAQAFTRYKTEECTQLLAQICERFPAYSDLDLISTRPYTLYDETLSDHSFEEVCEHFRTLVYFQALNAAIDENWRRSWPATSNEELTHLRQYVLRIKDTRLKIAVEHAMERYYEFKRNIREPDSFISSKDNVLWDTPQFTIFALPHFAETRYGVHIKKFDEWAIYGVFCGDRDEPYVSINRSSNDFSEEKLYTYDIPLTVTAFEAGLRLL